MRLFESIIAAWRLRKRTLLAEHQREVALEVEILAEKAAYKKDSNHIFFAGTSDPEYLAEVRRVVDAMVSGEFAMAEGRYRLSKKLKHLGYEPAVGIPDDMEEISPIERGSRKGQSSDARITLVLETNMRIAANRRRMVEGNVPVAFVLYPAWELVRLYQRSVPRGASESRNAGWAVRWRDAGKSVDWEGAVKSPMIARKDSPIWQALGDGAGGQWDTLGNPFPPFAIGSGMAWKSVERDRCIHLKLITADEMPVELLPGAKEIKSIFDQ